MMSQEKKHTLSWIDHNEQLLIKISDKVWELAELGLVEFKSSSLLADELSKAGFHIKMGISAMPTAFIGSWGKGSPVIGVMGEYDALPGLSQKKVTREEPLKMAMPGHGCGHNIHGTSGMAAAIAVKETMEACGLNGTIKFYGCPAEESFSGKVFMVRDGFFSGVDAVLSHHPDTMNGASLLGSLAVNSVKFHFHGKASHAGASPEYGRSALDAVELMNTGVNYLREHVPQDTRIHYIIEKGGDQPNIVPSYARSWYYVRAPERQQVEHVYDWILDIAKGAAKMTRTKLKVDYIEGCYNYIPNRLMSELIVNNMREIKPPSYSSQDWEFAEEISKTISSEMKISQLKKSKRPNWRQLIPKLVDDEIVDPWGDGETSHGSTDVADVSWQAPTVEFSTATWVLGTPAHTWQAVAQSGVGLGHKSLIFAAKAMAATLIDLLTDGNLLIQAKKEHEEKLRGQTYTSPLPQGYNPPLDPWKS